ncbi:MAG TPA: tyrosine-type recombinase/integrase [Thermoanaerobaculia bacterium]|jgi:integrase|nr:tyrosine-type recombinase/integrase [Thermoanaerobaculia bacterium]
MKRRLTEAVIPSLRTSLPQEDIFHLPTPGAGLRLTREGRKTWFLLYYAPGTTRKRRHYFGEHPSGKRGERRYLSLKEFEREYDMARGDLARGIDPQEKTAQVDPSTAKHVRSEALPEELRRVFPEGFIEGTVAALLADFLQNYAANELTDRGYLNYRNNTRAYLAPVFKIPILQFGEEDVNHLLAALTKRAPQCVRAAKNVLSCAFDWGKQHYQGVKANPCKSYKVMVKKGQRKRFLNDSEISSVFAALPKLKDQKAADVYALILASMCRPGEAAGICAEDVIQLNGERVWKLTQTKNDQDFLIPLFGPIAEVIDRRLAEVGGKGPLFWKTRGADYPQPLKNANEQLRELTGLDDIRPHDFRRTGRTHISGLGVRDEVAEALLNHAKEQVNGTYNLYTYWQERKDALKLWHAKLERLTAQDVPEAA